MPCPRFFPFPERTVVRWTRSGCRLVQGPGAHSRGALGCTWQHSTALARTCNAAQAAPPYDFLLADPSARHVGLRARCAVAPGALPEGPFPLSKNNPVSHLPPQPYWDSSVLLPSLARPLTRLHSWLCGPKLVLPEGRGWGNCPHYRRRVPLPVPRTWSEWAAALGLLLRSCEYWLVCAFFLPSILGGQVCPKPSWFHWGAT